MEKEQLKDFLEYKFHQFNNSEFIESDPILIPHRYSLKEDIEISGFLTAILSWGNRKAIQKSAVQLMEMMGNSPYEFVMKHSKHELKQLQHFYYRTFQPGDVVFYIQSIKNIYSNHGGFEKVFSKGYTSKNSTWDAIDYCRSIFFQPDHKTRHEKHFSSPAKGSAAKRIHMFLRWMVRKDNHGVDFGIWDSISTSHLICPLDLHSGNVARKLGILQRLQNDKTAAIELTGNLKQFDPFDPVKYDFALFGLGVFEKFK